MKKNKLKYLAKIPDYGLIDSNKSLRTFSFLIFSAFVCLIIILIFTPWLQTVQGYGKVIAYAPLERQQNIEAPIKGVVSQWYVKEGSLVKKGTAIALLADNDPLYLSRLEEQSKFFLEMIKAYQNKIQTYLLIIKNQEESREKALLSAEYKIKMAEEKIKASQNNLTASEATTSTAKINLERQEALEQKGLTSKRNLELSQLEYQKNITEYDKAKAMLEISLRELDVSLAERDKLERDSANSIEKTRTEINTAESEKAKALSDLNKINIDISRQRNQIIRSPVNGVIFRLRTNIGTEYVKEGDILASVVPDTDQVAVELLIRGNDIPLVSESWEVRLQFEGWPALQFNAWPSVAIGTFPGIVKLIDQTDNGDGQFRILVLPAPGEKWPEKKYLRQGVRAYGWVIINQVPLWYELWRQFNGFPPSVTKVKNNDEKKLDNIEPVKLKK